MIKCYKLFRIKEGKLYPLYVEANKETPLHQWLEAEAGELLPSGRVKAKLSGGLAYRPGWHSADEPVAYQIGLKPVKGKPTLRAPDQVWCECFINNEVDWQSKANAQGKTARDKCLKEIPYKGYYKYKTCANMFGAWYISGELYVNKILTDEEVYELNKQTGHFDLPRM